MSIIVGSIVKLNVPDNELHRRILERFNNGDMLYVNGISGYNFAYVNRTKSNSSQLTGTFIVNKKYLILL